MVGQKFLDVRVLMNYREVRISGNVLLSQEHGYFLVVDDGQIGGLDGFEPPVHSGWKKCYFLAKPQTDCRKFFDSLRASGISFIPTAKPLPN